LDGSFTLLSILSFVRKNERMIISISCPWARHSPYFRLPFFDRFAFQTILTHLWISFLWVCYGFFDGYARSISVFSVLLPWAYLFFKITFIHIEFKNTPKVVSPFRETSRSGLEITVVWIYSMCFHIQSGRVNNFVK